MTDFTIDETARGDGVALSLSGDLDMSATFALEPVLDRVPPTLRASSCSTSTRCTSSTRPV
jgi:hypothetical protein